MWNGNMVLYDNCLHMYISMTHGWIAIRDIIFTQLSSWHLFLFGNSVLCLGFVEAWELSIFGRAKWKSLGERRWHRTSSRVFSFVTHVVYVQTLSWCILLRVSSITFELDLGNVEVVFETKPYHFVLLFPLLLWRILKWSKEFTVLNCIFFLILCCFIPSSGVLWHSW